MNLAFTATCSLDTVLSHPRVKNETVEDSERGEQSRQRGGEMKRLKGGNWQKVRMCDSDGVRSGLRRKKHV